MSIPRFWKRQMPIVLMVSASLLVLVAGLLIIQQTTDNRRAKAVVAKAVLLANQGQPSPAPATIKPSPSVVSNYSVPPTQPRYLHIPKLAVDARVMPVSLTRAGAIGTPSNVFDTAWYTGSALPGKQGATLIDGHVSSATTQGVFYNLKSLQPGDSLSIELGNGTLLNYRVVKTQIYPTDAVDGTALLKPIDKTKPGLNLITCAGAIIKGSNDFSERVVVYTTQQ